MELGGSQTNVVSIATSYRLGGGLGFESQQEQDFFVSLELSRLAVVPIQPPLQLILGFFAGVKLMGHEVKPLTSVFFHSPLSYARVMYLHSPCMF